MKVAREIKKLTGWTGDARVFELSEPMQYEGGKTKYVVVSATVAPFTGAETYIFPSDEKGDVKKFSELDGSYRGGLDHAQALEGAGYEIVKSAA